MVFAGGGRPTHDIGSENIIFEIKAFKLKKIVQVVDLLPSSIFV